MIRLEKGTLLLSTIIAVFRWGQGGQEGGGRAITVIITNMQTSFTEGQKAKKTEQSTKDMRTETENGEHGLETFISGAF